MVLRFGWAMLVAALAGLAAAMAGGLHGLAMGAGALAAVTAIVFIAARLLQLLRFDARLERPSDVGATNLRP